MKNGSKRNVRQDRGPHSRSNFSTIVSILAKRAPIGMLELERPETRCCGRTSVREAPADAARIGEVRRHRRFGTATRISGDGSAFCHDARWTVIVRASARPRRRSHRGPRYFPPRRSRSGSSPRGSSRSRVLLSAGHFCNQRQGIMLDGRCDNESPEGCSGRRESTGTVRSGFNA